MNYLAIRKARKTSENTQQPDTSSLLPPKKKARFPNPLRSLHIIWDKENALLLFYNAFLFASFYDVGSAIPSQFAEIYHFNELQIGLCYIPFGLGSMSAALVNGQLLDRNFARWCKNLGVKIRKGRDQDLNSFPIEKARLQIALPAAYLTCALVCIFGWLIHYECPLAAVLVILFFTSLCMSMAFNVTSTLLIDFYPKSAATATAANNLVRCLLGAGFTAAVIPMIDAMGRGWTFTFLTLFLTVTSPMLWLVYFRGLGWRNERVERERAVKEEKERKESGVEGGNRGEVEDEKEDDGRQPPPVVGGLAEMTGVVEKEREVEGITSKARSTKSAKTGKKGRGTDEEENPDEGHDPSMSRTFSYESICRI
jgi:hypothetical protein